MDAEPEAIRDALLTQAVKEVYTPGVVTFGHGTYTKESAVGVLEGGLYSNKPELVASAATVISPFMDIQDRQEMNEVLTRIQHWPYHNEQVPFLVLIQLPLSEEMRQDERAHSFSWEQLVRDEASYFTLALQSLPAPHKIKGLEREFYYHVPREYIRGFVERQSGQFTPNEHFDPAFVFPPPAA